jgi:hypothetical protein
MNWLATALGSVLLYLILEIATEFLLDVGTAATRPIRRPIWAVFTRAQWPWPAALMAVFGTACSFAGAQLMQRPNMPKWAELVGIYLFLGGALVILAAPALWFEARRRATHADRADADRPAS